MQLQPKAILVASAKLLWNLLTGALIVLLIAPIVVIAGSLALFYMMGEYDSDPASPFAKEDICFVRSLPGATGRFVQYAPVRCSNHKQSAGEPVGADYGRIRFEDTDQDGTPEAIVESSGFSCRNGPAPCYDTYRIVLKVSPSAHPPVREVARVYLKELSVADE